MSAGRSTHAARRGAWPCIETDNAYDDVHEHPTEWPDEVSLEPDVPHPGAEPVEVSTEPRSEHPERFAPRGRVRSKRAAR